ncbi:MAG TPA: ABC transporter substrate-binding protein [Candidatus Polarisedimenticolaceae bacterium]|nr:ABC transporter substrate-binding protein [Candidatus Polarisedimenticolaceae bacterium]
MNSFRKRARQSLSALAVFAAAAICWQPSHAQQKELGEVNVLTAVSNMAFSALWVAEQLKYFEQEGVRAKITPAGGGAPCQNAVVGRSAHLCASSSEGLVLAQIEGAPLIAIQAHNRNLTLSIAVRKVITDKLKVTRSSPLNDRIKVLTELGTIGATSPGAVSEQIFKFLVPKVKGDPSKLKFVYLGGTELPPALMNNVIDALAQSPPSAEVTEAAGKGYVLLPLGLGEVTELTNYPYEVLMARPDWAEQNPALATAASRAISRAGALYHSNPTAFKAALRAHRYSDKSKLEDNVFDLAYSMIAPAMPAWGDMNQEGWQKVLDFSIGAGIVKDRAKAPSAKEGVLWTNKYAGK